MESKATLASVVAAAALAACANPTADNYHAVTNDWWNGNYTNVCELAQQRFAANSNDLVAAHIMWEYDICFSDFAAMSNSIMRLVRIADEVTLPAYTNRYQRLREGYGASLAAQAPRLSSSARARSRAASFFMDVSPSIRKRPGRLSYESQIL